MNKCFNRGCNYCKDNECGFGKGCNSDCHWYIREPLKEPLSKKFQDYAEEELPRLRKQIEELTKENAELKARLNPQTLYGIENGKVEKLLNVVVEYHFYSKGSAMGGWVEANEIGKYAFLTKAEAEKALKEKSEVGE